MTSAVTDLLNLASEHGPTLVLIMFAASFAEAAFGLGAFVPGETIVAAGAFALSGQGLVLGAWPAVALGAFLGDHAGYLLGRRFGPALARSAPVRKAGEDRWNRVTGLVRERGLWVLVVARLVPGIRTLVAAAAGVAGVGYGRFALADAAGAILWSSLWVFGGVAMGRSLVSTASSVAVPVFIGIVAVAGAVAVIRRRLSGS
ncbi:DedA family protein [Nonomuraea terrae]|nr:VTT domain-containing protein [Nonomuraea terrae]